MNAADFFSGPQEKVHQPWIPEAPQKSKGIKKGMTLAEFERAMSCFEDIETKKSVQKADNEWEEQPISH